MWRLDERNFKMILTLKWRDTLEGSRMDQAIVKKSGAGRWWNHPHRFRPTPAWNDVYFHLGKERLVLAA